MVVKIRAEVVIRSHAIPSDLLILEGLPHRRCSPLLCASLEIRNYNDGRSD